MNNKAINNEIALSPVELTIGLKITCSSQRRMGRDCHPEKTRDSPAQ
jgi:hypothetical protein